MDIITNTPNNSNLPNDPRQGLPREYPTAAPQPAPPPPTPQNFAVPPTVQVAAPTHGFFNLGWPIIYLVLLISAVFGVYAWQNNKLDLTNKKQTVVNETAASANESSQINEDNLQAVFLDDGNTYFGNITELNSRYLTLENIYYLRNQQVVNNPSTTPATDISLVKLGCEIHGPKDSMVIYISKIKYWENLKADGQVAKAVSEYKKQSPNGQSCIPT